MTGLSWPAEIRGVLLDVDGTLLDCEKAIAGGPEALARLRSRGVRVRLTTNTTRRPRSETAAVLTRAGFEVKVDEILIPASLARQRIVQSGRRRANLLVPDSAIEDFDGVEAAGESADWVVVGDLGAAFTFDRLNEAFLHLRGGAKLIALHKNRFWHAAEKRGLVLDAGPFVAALEYAAGVDAEIVGKPSPRFFELALTDLGLSPDQVIVVGDDVVNDIGGGAAASCRTALVRTGKFAHGAIDTIGTPPDLILDSIADLFP